MNEVDKGYELQVLKMVVDRYLNETISFTEASLRELETNRDSIVWDLATKIYSQSGHRIELSIVRDIINSRIKTIKEHITAQKNSIVEQSWRLVQDKVRQTVEEVNPAVTDEDSLPDEIGSVLAECGGDKHKAEVFVRLRKVISEYLDIDENEVSLDSHLSDDLGMDVDTQDLMEFVMTLEEEFDIKISDTETEEQLGIFYYQFWSFLGSSSSSDSSSGFIEKNCIVKNIVDFISKKIST